MKEMHTAEKRSNISEERTSKCGSIKGKSKAQLCSHKNWEIDPCQACKIWGLHGKNRKKPWRNVESWLGSRLRFFSDFHRFTTFDILCPKEPKYYNLNLHSADFQAIYEQKFRILLSRISGYWLGSLAKRTWDHCSSAFSRQGSQVQKRKRDAKRQMRKCCVDDLREMYMAAYTQSVQQETWGSANISVPKICSKFWHGWLRNIHRQGQRIPLLTWKRLANMSTGFDLVRVGRFATPEFTPKRGTRASRGRSQNT